MKLSPTLKRMAKERATRAAADGTLTYLAARALDSDKGVIWFHSRKVS
jgi:hypothetical protein